MRSHREDGQSSTLPPMYAVLKHYPNTAQLHCHHAIIEVQKGYGTIHSIISDPLHDYTPGFMLKHIHGSTHIIICLKI